MNFSSINSLKVCLKMGLGIGLFPEIAIENELREKELVRLTMGTNNLETSVIMIWHAQKWRSPALDTFLKLAREIIA